ncbi:gamma-tubulin complex component 3 isoform X1 [Halictus rubicundus]|uniref:gamma-tubulin complex component 3 isoform X1 n=1 Tax=Halictus rubicundus TaxID=77578 RepID=UPI0040359681
MSEAEIIGDLVQKLILSLCGDQKTEVVRKWMRFALEVLSSSQGIETLQEDEVTIANHIKDKLSRSDTVQFDKLFHDLKDGPLKNRTQILVFLINMSETGDNLKKRIFSVPDLKLGLTAAHASSSATTPDVHTPPQIVSVNNTEKSSRDFLTRSNRILGEEYISEEILVQDLIYSFQGIEGKILKLDSNYGFQIDPMLNIDRPRKQSTLRLSELGHLHNIIQKGLERISAASSGQVADSFVAALYSKLSEYYRFIATIQEEVNRAHLQLGLYKVTLSHLHLWAYEPLETLKWLASMVRACQGQKGGALASAVYEFSNYGDADVKKLIKEILESVCDPLYNMLIKWIADGELDDPYREFFIETCADITGERMWHEKYQVRNSMLPSFISKSQAKKILGTGKSINFLREVCKDITPWQGKHTNMFKNFTEEYKVDVLFDMDPDGRLQNMMDTAYKATSTRVVEVLTKQYHFMDHLHAIKGYLLLGQGHFIQHLMHLLELELDKPASSLYPHNISSILETGIRATSAKIDDLDLDGRLDVRLLAPSENETGWDVFILDYNVSGPIGTILEPYREVYQTIFFALWRAKRMESILCAIWKRQITSAKMFRKMPEVLTIQTHIHLITSSMVHLVHQMQYFFLFEVIECSWDAFAKQLGQAVSLDDIITAHTYFIDTIRRGTFLDEKSQELMDHLRSVYGPILDLQNLEETFLKVATREYEARLNDASTTYSLKRPDHTDHTDEEVTKRQATFLKHMNTLFIQLRLLSRTYQDRVKKFLIMLASAEDVSLQLLSVRLDFNEYYKSKDNRLVVPLTYQHRR